MSCEHSRCQHAHWHPSTGFAVALEHDLRDFGFRMALQNITNVGKGSSYTATVILDSKFAPVVRKGVRIDQQSSRAEFPALRDSGATNIDLWLDGNLYPTDHVTGKPPPFQTIKSCLEFVCHGEYGLLGYSRNLVSTCDSIKGLEKQLEETQADAIRKTLGLQNSIALLTQVLDVANSSWAQRSEELLARSTEEIATLKSGLDYFRARCVAVEEELQRNEDQHNSNLQLANEQGRQANAVVAASRGETKPERSPPLPKIHIEEDKEDPPMPSNSGAAVNATPLETTDGEEEELAKGREDVRQHQEGAEPLEALHLDLSSETESAGKPQAAASSSLDSAEAEVLDALVDEM